MGVAHPFKFKVDKGDPIVRRLDFGDSAIEDIEPRARPKCRFIDDAAVESDGEGGDVPSAATTPDVEFIDEAPAVKWDPKLPHPAFARLLQPAPKPAAKLAPPFRKPTAGLFKPRYWVGTEYLRAKNQIAKPLVIRRRCDLCQLVVSGPKQLTQHRGGKKCERRQAARKVYPCGFCKKVLDNQHNLDKHIATKHK